MDAGAVPIYLATALGLPGSGSGNIAVCASPNLRRAYRAFLADQDCGGLGLHDAHPQAVAFLVRFDDTPVGAASILPDSPLGLPLPERFQTTLADLRREGHRLTLLDRLVVADSLDGEQADLALRSLLRLALLTARRLDGRTDVLVCCGVDPARLFLETLGFVIAAGLSPGGPGPAQLLLRLDLARFPSELCPGGPTDDGDPWSPRNLHSRPSPQTRRITAWLQRQRRPPGLDELIDLWTDPTDGAPPLDSEACAALCRLYPALTGCLPRRQRAATGGTRTDRHIRLPALLRRPLPDGLAARMSHTACTST